MSFYPVTLVREGEDALRIEWSDGMKRKYTVKELRLNCPCAACQPSHTPPEDDPMALPVISLQETQPLRLLSMEPVGHYAYRLHFSDGHQTGIYTLDHLRGLGEEIA